jgi:hypothetical protein
VEVKELLIDGSNFERTVPLKNGYLIETGSLLPRGFKLYLVRG